MPVKQLFKIGHLTLIFIIFLYICAWTGRFQAIAAGQGQIEGTVMNGTQDSSAVTQREVQLHLFYDGQEDTTALRISQTNAQGRFRFVDLPVDSGYIYYPSVIHQSIYYYGAPIDFRGQAQLRKSDVVVYDTTSTGEGLSVNMHHLFVEVIQGKVTVRELIILHNSTNKTIIGVREVTPDVRATLCVPLPQGAANLQLLGGLSESSTWREDNYLYDAMECRPGIRQISFRYQLGYTGTQLLIEKKMGYDTRLFDIFVLDPNLEVSGPDLTPMGFFNIRGQSYRRFMAENLKAEQTVQIYLSNLPEGTKDLRWLAFLGLGLVCLWGLSYPFLKKPDRRNADVARLEKEKTKLIATIAELDDQFEAGELNQSEYSAQRNKMKKRLIRVISSCGRMTKSEE